MSNQHLPPTAKRQDWIAIWAIFALLFTVILAGLAFWSWNWVSHWGSLQAHWPFTQPRDFLMVDMWQRQFNDYWLLHIKRHNLQWHFYAHAGIPALIALFIAGFVASLAYVPGGYDRLRHMQGLRRYEYKQALKHAKQQLKRDCKANNVSPGLELTPGLKLSTSHEEMNVFIAGSQGAGKTVILCPIVQKIIERQARVFIYDRKREFTSWFYNQQTVLIAPWDKRSKPWDISRDAANPALAQLISESMIAESGNDPIWCNGSRMLFTGMMVSLNHTHEQWGWKELANMLSLPEAELLVLLEQYYPRASRFIVENSKTTQSFYATLLGYLGFIYTLAEAWPQSYENGFAITVWTANEQSQQQTVIVQAHDTYKDVGAPVCSAMISLMTATALSQSNSFSRELWLCLDELSNLPANPSILEWLSLGRSKGCRCLAATQSLSALRDASLYGEHGTDALLALFGVFIGLRMSGAGSSAEYCAKAFGEYQVERPTSSAGAGESAPDNWHLETLPIVTTSDLAHELPQPGKRGVHGFLLIPGWAVYKLCWPIASLPQIAEEHVPAEWLSYKPKPAAEPTEDISSSNRRGRRRSS